LDRDEDEVGAAELILEPPSTRTLSRSGSSMPGRVVLVLFRLLEPVGLFLGAAEQRGPDPARTRRMAIAVPNEPAPMTLARRVCGGGAGGMRGKLSDLRSGRGVRPAGRRCPYVT